VVAGVCRRREALDQGLSGVGFWCRDGSFECVLYLQQSPRYFQSIAQEVFSH
jgi:hypothetical protein